MSADLNSPILHAVEVKQPGGQKVITADMFDVTFGSQSEFRWVHICAKHSSAPDWLAQQGLEERVVKAMTAETTRPRVLVRPEGVLLILRAMDMHDGAAPEDMISLRIWINSSEVISARCRDIVAVEDVIEMNLNGQGPVTSGEFLVTILTRIYERMEPVLEDLNVRLALSEKRLLDDESEDVSSNVSLIRKRAMVFTRYVAPQKLVLKELTDSSPDWLSEEQRSAIHECLDQVTRYDEELTEITNRGEILNEELNSVEARRLNDIAYMFSVAATIFLPLGFLTGLLGINVGGMPGVQSANAFWLFTFLCIALVVIQIAVFKKLKLF